MCDVFVVYMLDVTVFQACMSPAVCVCVRLRVQLKYLRRGISVFMIAGGGGGQQGHPVRTLKVWVCCDI